MAPSAAGLMTEMRWGVADGSEFEPPEPAQRRLHTRHAMNRKRAWSIPGRPFLPEVPACAGMTVYLFVFIV